MLWRVGSTWELISSVLGFKPTAFRLQRLLNHRFKIFYNKTNILQFCSLKMYFNQIYCTCRSGVQGLVFTGPTSFHPLFYPFVFARALWLASKRCKTDTPSQSYHSRGGASLRTGGERMNALLPNFHSGFACDWREYRPITLRRTFKPTN